MRVMKLGRGRELGYWSYVVRSGPLERQGAGPSPLPIGYGWFLQRSLLP